MAYFWHRNFSDMYYTELMKFRPVRISIGEGKPERAPADQAVTLMKFGRVRIS
jgi:hypothetical protein